MPEEEVEEDESIEKNWLTPINKMKICATQQWKDLVGHNSDSKLWTVAYSQIQHCGQCHRCRIDQIK